MKMETIDREELTNVSGGAVVGGLWAWTPGGAWLNAVSDAMGGLGGGGMTGTWNTDAAPLFGSKTTNNYYYGRGR